MPKRSSKPKHGSLDTVQNAHRVFLESVGLANDDTATPTAHPSVISQIMAEMGRKGGRIGGKRRLETMSKKERSDVAKTAAKARWAKVKRSKKV